jgi:hypothetical protein
MVTRHNNCSIARVFQGGEASAQAGERANVFILVMHDRHGWREWRQDLTLSCRNNDGACNLLDYPNHTLQ